MPHLAAPGTTFATPKPFIRWDFYVGQTTYNGSCVGFCWVVQACLAVITVVRVLIAKEVSPIVRMSVREVQRLMRAGAIRSWQNCVRGRWRTTDLAVNAYLAEVTGAKPIRILTNSGYIENLPNTARTSDVPTRQHLPSRHLKTPVG